jgi:DivIVA domain-containing protein
MPLTPEDVSNKRFTPVRLREGYDMGEVDQFLDEVEAELERLIAESDDLRAKLAAQGGDAPVPQPRSEPKSADTTPRLDKVADTPAGTGSVAAAAPRETIKVITAAEASSAALRLLELATKNADEVVAEAKEEAEQIVGAARTEADRLESETKERTDTLEQEARSRAQNLDAETESRRSQLLGDMEREKSRLDTEVDTLRAFEREYRSRLKSYFNEQLQALDALSEGGDLPESGDGGEPRRLKSILGGDPEPQAGEPGEGTEENAEQGGPDESETPKV